MIPTKLVCEFAQDLTCKGNGAIAHRELIQPVLLLKNFLLWIVLIVDFDPYPI